MVGGCFVPISHWQWVVKELIAMAATWPAMSLEAAHALLTAPGSPFETEQKVISGVTQRTWKNAPASTRDLVGRALVHGEKVFLVLEDERVTYSAFHRAVAAFAAELAARGLSKGDRVAIAMRNLPEWPVAFFGASVIGAIVAPLNAWWTGPELEYGLRDAGARFLVADAERYERVADRLESLPDLEAIYVSRAAAAPPDAIRLEDVIGAPDSWAGLPDAPLPHADLGPEDDATIFYTSGTTGHPKGAVATHRNALSNIVAAACCGARTYLRRGEEIPAPPLDGATLMTVPFFHVTGTFAILSPTLNAGYKLVMMRRWDAEEAMRLIEREKVTGATVVPTIAWQLVEHPARAKYDLSSLAGLGFGGASAAPELQRRIGQTMPGTLAGHGWGMTETSALATTHMAEDYAAKPDSCGPAVPVTDLKIMSPDGARELPPGEVGELWCKGPQVVRGYWNKPEATAETFRDGWLRTGDLATLDQEGWLYIVDRAKDMLIRGGENIYCVEVENALYEHPAVMDAAVVGMPHRTLGEEPAAVVALKPGANATVAELRAHVAERLAAFKVPVAIRFSSETLPRNANGKILKPELKKLFD
jgi:long-chain acyl-CoA synthetase